MNNKLKPALIGGVALGLLSAIPFINIPNLCCCAWAIAGGVLAANMYVKGSSTPATMGDGAAVGAISGLIGGVIYVVIGLPLGLLTGSAITGIMVKLVENMDPSQAEAMRRQMEAQATGTLIEQLVVAIPFTLLWFVLLVVFATIGGLIGTKLFEKRTAGAMPPPPSGFGA